jgi:hypothetical protein
VAAPDTTALQRSDLNPFLFADIGTEANGMTLSVMPVLARRGADPWTEAGRLAVLAKPEAVDSLANMIATMPASLWAAPDAAIIAARLIGLLPARPGGIHRAGIKAPEARGAGILQSVRQWPVNQIALVAACVALVVAFAIMMLQQ